MKIVTFGEIMLRLAPPGYLRFSQAQEFNVIYGGGESNVAVALANFGMEAHFVTRLPDNDIGDCALMELRKRGVHTEHIVRGGERLGIYFLEMGAVQRGSKVIYDRANSGMATIEPGMVDWDEVLRDADWFHWTGITPALSQGAADACLEAIQVANRLGVTVSTDLNYRKKLWQYGKDPQDVMPDLVEGCDIILGNEEDAEKHFGLHPEEVDVTAGGEMDGTKYLPVLKEIMERFPRCKMTITTLRGSVSASHNSWSGVLYDGKKLYETETYQITDIVDRVGGGDSFMSALIYGLLTYKDDKQRALDFAVGASCLKHTIYGDANLVTVDEVIKLVDGDGSGRVSR
ncbi:PfkB family carbohydrate kinase [Neolewinella sp.]|uniref:PfkB family carbohydrate kinase n=1 Tax=Neolewinella sp. TaxID=2993543 RepID=UPI003B527518